MFDPANFDAFAVATNALPSIGLAAIVAATAKPKLRFCSPLAGAYAINAVSHLGPAMGLDPLAAEKLALSGSFCSSALGVCAYLLLQKSRKDINLGAVGDALGIASAVFAFALAIYGSFDLSVLEVMDAATSLAALGLLSVGLVRFGIENKVPAFLKAASMAVLYSAAQLSFVHFGHTPLYLYSLSLLGFFTASSIISASLIGVRTGRI